MCQSTDDYFVFLTDYTVTLKWVKTELCLLLYEKLLVHKILSCVFYFCSENAQPCSGYPLWKVESS